jgi:hypothetical protein
MKIIRAMLNAAIIQSIAVKGGRWSASLAFDDFSFVLLSIDVAPIFFAPMLNIHSGRIIRPSSSAGAHRMHRLAEIYAFPVRRSMH